MFKTRLHPTMIAVALAFAPATYAANEAETWQVNAPTNAPLEKVSVDVNEGTWMNLSLSPDGKYIVFDLLGDIDRKSVV